MHSRNLSWVILALFFGSGATALVYEVVWSKFLSQMLGSTIYAQTVVLAVFMGGLAIGNRLFGRLADRLHQPVQMYGILEICIGLYAILFPGLDRVADTLFIKVGSGIADNTALLTAWKGALSAGLLLGPTILMGGTLPLMASWLQRSSMDAGRRSARFYSVNSLGAVAGSALAGFWLVYHYGMVATLYYTATANILLGTAAVLLSRAGLIQLSRPVESAETAKTRIASPGTLRLAGLIVAVTGGVSMGLEVVASRSLALMFGSSLQSFAIVLMAFILGIGLGSAWIASTNRKIRSAEAIIVVLLCLAAGWVALLVFNIERWVDFYRLARTGLGRTEVGYIYNLLINSGISLVIMGVPAALIGAVLPLMIRALSREGIPLGEHVGALLTWNTLGAVVGVLLTGFFIMPTVGLRSAFGVLALVLSLAALVLASRRRWRAGVLGAATVSLFVSGLFFFGTEGWQHVMASGVFRVWDNKFDPRLMELRKKHIDIVFYEDAPDATVSVEQVDGIIGPASLGLRINGKPDAGTDVDICNQLLLAHLPMLVKPEATNVFVLGLGSGMTAGAVLAYPVEQVTVAENCEPIVRAAKLFRTWNCDLHENPRVKIWVEDARTALKLSPQLYDVFITEPSNPWTIGVGSVFSKEFYELAASRLKPGGIMSQWFHLYEVDDRIIEVVLRTFSSVFPYVEIWDTGIGDMVMLGSLQPWRTGPEAFRKSFEIERVRTDMQMINVQSPEALFARQLASQGTAFAIPGAGELQSDAHPILEYVAPKAFFLGNRSRVLDRVDERTRQQLLAPASKRTALASLSPTETVLMFTDFSTINGELHGCVMGTPDGENVPCALPTSKPAPPPASTGSLYDQAAQAFAGGNVVLAKQMVQYALQMNTNDLQAAYLARVFERASPSLGR